MAEETQLIESLRQRADAETAIGSKADLLFDIAYLHLQRGNTRELYALTNELRHLIEPADEDRIAQLDTIEAMIAFFEMRPEQARGLLQNAIALFDRRDNKLQKARSLSIFALGLWSLGEYGEALQAQLEAVRLFEQVDDKMRQLVALYMLGNHYFDLKDYDNAQQYYLISQEISRQAAARGYPNQGGYARTLIGLGGVALVKQQYAEALQYFKEAYEIQVKIQDLPGQGRSLNDIAKVYMESGDFVQAENYFRQSLEKRQLITNRGAYVTTLIDLADLYMRQSRYEQAFEILQGALELSEKLSAKAKTAQIYQLLSRLHKEQGNHQQALACFERFFELKEELSGDDASLKIRQLEKRWESDRKEKEAEIHRLRNVELKNAYDEITEQNRSIKASINYASRIQQAMLPQPQDLAQSVRDAFVYFKPRDIVSGDFYWFDFDRQGRLIIVAADCTGHGVPGALMSMIGMKLLEEIVHQSGISSPAAILTELHLGILKALRQKDSGSHDGMDAAICIWNPATRELTFSGAKSSMIYTNHQGNVTELKGDKLPIGGAQIDTERNYSEQTIMAGDTPFRCYLFSDGYKDQFGGTPVSKFGSRRFRALLQELQPLPMSEQQALIEQRMEEWRNTSEGYQKQLDDIMILGIEC